MTTDSGQQPRAWQHWHHRARRCHRRQSRRGNHKSRWRYYYYRFSQPRVNL